METFVADINKLREDTIAKHFLAAYEELKSKIVEAPLQLVYKIQAGCVSKEIATEIAHRFSVGNGYTATVCANGLITSTFSLEVKLPLPANLIHETPVETKVVAEEQKTV